MEEFKQYSTLYPSSGFVHRGCAHWKTAQNMGEKGRKKDRSREIKSESMQK
jgi:hypothetical protein